MKFETIINELTERRNFMNKMGVSASVDESALRELLSQQQEIEELKQLAETKNARTLERIGRIERQEREITELKAMVNVLRRAADLYHSGYKASELEEAAAIMNMSPAQCLQSVKADAVKEFGHEIGLYDSEYDDQEYIEVSRYSLREHIEQLREGKS